MLTKRGELLVAAQDVVRQSSYQFKKGQSRSKKVAEDKSQPKKWKVDKDLQAQRIQELKEDMKDCNTRITFKEKGCDAAWGTQNYKACDNLTEEISALKARRRELEAELKEYERKELKSKWYYERKVQESAITIFRERIRRLALPKHSYVSL